MRVLIVVKGHTWTDNIEHRDTFMGISRLDEFLHLLCVSSKGARHKGRVRYDSLHTNINGHIDVGALLLQMQAVLGSGGELSFGQPVYTVVFDNVYHVDIAAHNVLELTHANAGGVTVAGDRNAFQRLVAKEAAGGDRRHASVQAVEAKRTIHKIGGAFA